VKLFFGLGGGKAMTYERPKEPSLFYQKLQPLHLDREDDAKLLVYDQIMTKLDIVKAIYPFVRTEGEVDTWGMPVDKAMLKNLSCNSSLFLKSARKLSFLIEYDKGEQRRLHLMSSNKQIVFVIEKENHLIYPNLGTREGGLIKKPWKIQRVDNIPISDAVVMTQWLP
jgi:hypothetical protein